MIAVTYRNGIAIVSDLGRTTEVNVSITAQLIHQGDDIEVNKADVRALAAGYQALKTERNALRDELAAARAGTIGKEHAEAMQGARKVIADLNRIGFAFLAVYDQGDAPDIELDKALRDKLASADLWLISDSNAASVRAKVLKSGQQ